MHPFSLCRLRSVFATRSRDTVLCFLPALTEISTRPPTTVNPPPSPAKHPGSPSHPNRCTIRLNAGTDAAGSPNAMPLVLRRDPRPTGYDSVTEAVFAPDDAGDIVDAAVECVVWAPVRPTVPANTLPLVFVDGVERRECRVWGIGDGLPRLGLMVSYAAGAIVPSDVEPLPHVSVRHRILMTKGATTPPIHLIADNVTVEYLPEHNAGEDAESIFSSLRQLRSDLETAVVLRL